MHHARRSRDDPVPVDMSEQLAHRDAGIHQNGRLSERYLGVGIDTDKGCSVGGLVGGVGGEGRWCGIAGKVQHTQEAEDKGARASHALGWNKFEIELWYVFGYDRTRTACPRRSNRCNLPIR